MERRVGEGGAAAGEKVFFSADGFIGVGEKEKREKESLVGAKE